VSAEVAEMTKDEQLVALSIAAAAVDEGSA
jgi:hypothetical protein